MSARRPVLLASSLAGLALGLGPGAGRLTAQGSAHGASGASCAAADDACAALARPVALRLADVPLGEALSRLGEAAGVRISFSPDRVPVARRVSLAGARTTLGAALEEVLRGTGVGIAVASGGVVLTPPRAGAVEPQALDRVVVTGGEPTGAPPAAAVTVVTREDLDRWQVTRLDEVFRAVLPGADGWATGPAGSALRFGSLRGASSFALSYPKVYVDGAEVASPLHVAAVDVASVERVEIIRGPQGAALYGPDAIGGVVHIITDKGRMAPGRHLRAHLSTAAGVVQGDDGHRTPPLQSHALSVEGSGKSWAFTAGGSSYAVGPWAPGAGGSGTGMRLGARVTRGRLVIDGSALRARQRGGGSSLGGAETDAAAGELERLDHTVSSLTARWQPSPRVAHTLTVGVDRQSIDNLLGLLPSPATREDSALVDARGVLVRRAVRYAAAIALPDASWGTGTVTLGAERATTAHDLALAPGDGSDVRRRSGSGGVLAQAAVSLRGGLHLSAGLRAEHHDDFGALHGVEALPMAGAALVRAIGRAEVTGRVSYGRGIRAPAASAAGALVTSAGVQRANPLLGPERQEGVEAGVEVRVGERGSLQVTRYDQVAEGLVQRVPVAGPRGAEVPAFQQQNVGVIANRGWELQSALRAGPVDLWATLALTDSRVRRVAPGYDGDLRAGDRPLGVARHAASGTAALPLGPARLALTAVRVGPRVVYDRRALRDAGHIPPGGTRAFWVDYDPYTEYGMSLGLPLAPGRKVLLKVDDLFDRRGPQRDNLGAAPGRTTVAVLQLGF